MDDFKPERFTEREAYLWSIERASQCPGDEWLGIPTLARGRGEVIALVSRIAKDFDWPIPRVRRFMLRMEQAGRWRVRALGKGLVLITVCDFDQHVPPAAKGLQ